MARHTPKKVTFESNSWNGSNTEEFKAWAEPFLPALFNGHTRVWSIIDNQNDPQNVIPNGILRSSVSNVRYSSFTVDFVLDGLVLAGPLFGGLPSVFGISSLQNVTPALLNEQFD